QERRRDDQHQRERRPGRHHGQTAREGPPADQLHGRRVGRRRLLHRHRLFDQQPARLWRIAVDCAVGGELSKGGVVLLHRALLAVGSGVQYQFFPSRAALLRPVSAKRGWWVVWCFSFFPKKTPGGGVIFAPPLFFFPRLSRGGFFGPPEKKGGGPKIFPRPA